MRPSIKFQATCFFAFLMSNDVHSAQLLNLNFDEANGSAIVANSAPSSNSNFNIRWVNNPPERVPGVAGNAFRSDGYSTWVTGSFNPAVTNQFSVSTWIALESYPSTVEGNQQDSALIHQFDAGKGFLIGINTYGNWWFTCNVAGQAVTLNAPSLFPLYDWTQVSATVDNGLVKLYLNGAVVAQKQVNAGNLLMAPNVPLVIARSNTPQIDGPFEVNAINAAYDNTRIYDTALTATELASDYQALKNVPWQPSIAVPATRFADDLLRPRFHAMPPANWTNEPHGLVMFNGQYHMFYQRTPNGPFKWMMHWGHMVSNDFIHWQNLKDAFYPAQNINGMSGLGSKGIWSGDVVIDNGVANAFYTTVNFDGKFDPGVAWATSTDSNLENWTKKGGVIDKNNPNPGAISDFRDPFVWKQDNRWHMIIGAAVNGRGGVEHYTASTLGNSWVRAALPFASHSFQAMDIASGSAIWEMPVFSYLGKTASGQDKYILVVSPIGGSTHKNTAPYVRSVYWTGTWNPNASNGEGQFVPDFDVPKNLDVIHGHLSPTITRDAAGNLTAIGIVDERSNSQMQNDLGWAHTYSLPRNWSLLSDGVTLGQSPVATLDTLRVPGSAFNLASAAVNGEQALNISGNQLEINVQVDPAQTGSAYGVVVAASPDRQEYTRIYYDGNNLVIDKSHSSLRSGLEENGLYSGSYDNQAFGKPDSFRVYVDHSVVTVFVNNKAVFENRIYPSRADSTQVALYSVGTTQFKNVSAYKMNAADFAPSATVVLSGTAVEHTENGAVINATLTNDTFAPSLSTSAWKAIGFPAGVGITSVERTSATTAKITLSGNSTSDYDTDINNASIQINGNQFVAANQTVPITAVGITFSAVVEPVTKISISTDAPIYEGSEAGKVIKVALSNNSFKMPLNPADWKVSNLPAGLTYSLQSVDASTVKIVLAGQPSDYSADVTNLTVDVAPTAFTNPDPELHGNAVVNTGVKFVAVLGRLNYDFETGDLSGWCSSGGDAFTSLGVTTDSVWWGGVFDIQGTYHFWGFNSGGDTSVGQMRTGNFVIGGDGQFSFKVAGGNDINSLYVAVVRASDNVEIFKATGSNSEAYETKTFDAKAYMGQTVYIKAVDNVTGGWGHINLDDIRAPVADSSNGKIPLSNVVPVTGITIPSGVMGDLQVGQTVTVSATVSPANACVKNIVWTSSDNSVATVQAGVVTAKAPGYAIITATTVDGGYKAQASLTVAGTTSSSSSVSSLSSSSKSSVSSSLSTSSSSSSSKSSISSSSIGSSSSVSGSTGYRVYDFEAGDLSGWAKVGAAFSVADISTATTFWGSTPFNQQGAKHLWSFQDGGDAQTGTLTTDSFTLGGDGRISFLVSGGNDITNLYVALIRVYDGAELMKVTGNNTEAYSQQIFDASAYIGEQLAVRIVDNSTGGFGHINLDNLRIPVGVAPNKLVLDFESGNLNGWTTTGDAFSAGDVTQDACYWNECISFARQGAYHLWGFKAGGDTQIGEMRSQNFVLAGNGNISLLIGGGNDINLLYVALVDASTQQELIKVTANNNETLSPVFLNGKSYVGRSCYLKVVDKSTGGFGHLNLDNVQIPVN